MSWSLRKAMGWDITKPQVMSKLEIVPGTAKPSIILLGMVVTHVTKDIEKLRIDRQDSYDRCEEYSFENDRINLKFTLRWDRGAEERRYSSGTIVIDRLKVGGKMISFKPEEYKTILQKLIHLCRIRTDMIEVKKEEVRQQEAISIIEEFFKPKPIELPPVEPAAELLEELTIEPVGKRRSKKLQIESSQLSPV